MYMSVLFAISKITTLKRDEDYPLIFDAPTSSFGDFKEDIFYNIIDNIDKQCIIFTKDLLRYNKGTEKRELDFDKINQLSCSVYRIQKSPGYDEEDLSTIRTITERIKQIMAEKLYDLWAKRNPNWEKRFEDSIIKNFSDYGKGVTKLGEAKGKLFGAGYEVFIIAFFIGLYYGQRRKLIDDSTKIKSLGQPIQYWGNIDSVKGRKAYPKLKEFIFIALVAKTDFDFIALDKGLVTPRKAVDALMQTMEEYANWGFHFMEDKLIDNPNYFYRETAFLEIFLTFDSSTTESTEDEPESLD